MGEDDVLGPPGRAPSCLVRENVRCFGAAAVQGSRGTFIVARGTPLPR